MKYFTIRFAVALITFIIGLSVTSVLLISHLRPQKQEPPPVAALPLTAVPRPTTTADSNGLEIPGLSQSVIAKPRQRYKPQEFKNIYVTLLDPKGYVLATFALHGRQENGEVVFGESRQRGVHSITRYDVDGQPFCYQIMANIPGVSSLVAYDYYDDDGDGKFDRCVKGAWPRTPTFPEWVISKR
jgi:hypothetical protein